MLSGRGQSGESESFNSPAKVGVTAPKKDENFEDFPEALDSEDDDLPF
jgi:hypothetical protein